MPSWKRTVTKGVLNVAQIYYHPMHPAVKAMVTKREKGLNNKEGWYLYHNGETNGIAYKTKKAAIAAFKPNNITIKNMMTGKLVDVPEDTPYFLRVDSETYWSS